ncbi:MAG TPA: hypothetical protein VI636_22465 [Candidatus Angelobacter sp.]
MVHVNKLSLIAVTFLLATCAVRSAKATEPPADLCSLLSAAEVSTTLGGTYDSPQKSVAPRPFSNTATGTDCNYLTKGNRLWFRAYVDPSPAAAADLFARLSKFYAPPTPVPGLGDQAYFDKNHGLHVLKGKVRFFMAMDSFTPANERQLKALAGLVVGRI